MKNSNKRAIEVYITIMGVLLFSVIMLVTNCVWQLLEVIEYGHTTPSIADTIICLLFNWTTWYVVWHQKWFWNFARALFKLLLRFVEFFY